MLAGIFYILFSISTATAATPSSTGQCCFVHPNYSGVCVVQPAGNETCASILGYLNSAGSAGKTYCGSTTIRGGWSRTKCP